MIYRTLASALLVFSASANANDRVNIAELPAASEMFEALAVWASEGASVAHFSVSQSFKANISNACRQVNNEEFLSEVMKAALQAFEGPFEESEKAIVEKGIDELRMSLSDKNSFTFCEEGELGSRTYGEKRSFISKDLIIQYTLGFED